MRCTGLGRRPDPVWPHLLLCLTLASSLGACSADNPTQPSNQSPQILSLTVFPTSLGTTDSVIVTCNAWDPDADQLVYDWITDARLQIKDPAVAGDNFLFNTVENSHVFYHGNLPTPHDSAFVQCIVRDRRGGGAGAIVMIDLVR